MIDSKEYGDAANFMEIIDKRCKKAGIDNKIQCIDKSKYQIFGNKIQYMVNNRHKIFDNVFRKRKYKVKENNKEITEIYKNSLESKNISNETVTTEVTCGLLISFLKKLEMDKQDINYQNYKAKHDNFLRKIQSCDSDVETGKVKSWDKKTVFQYFKNMIDYSVFINQFEMQSLNKEEKNKVLEYKNNSKELFERVTGYMFLHFKMNNEVLTEIANYCIRSNNFSFLSKLIHNSGISHKDFVGCSKIIVNTLLSHINTKQNSTKDFLIDIKFDRFVQSLLSKAEEHEHKNKHKAFFALLIKNAEVKDLFEMLKCFNNAHFSILMNSERILRTIQSKLANLINSKKYGDAADFIEIIEDKCYEYAGIAQNIGETKYKIFNNVLGKSIYKAIDNNEKIVESYKGWLESENINGETRCGLLISFFTTLEMNANESFLSTSKNLDLMGVNNQEDDFIVDANLGGDDLGIHEQ